MGQLPTGEADLIVRGLAERVRIIRTRVPASVETVARSLTRPSRSRDVASVDSGAGGRQSGDTWAVQPRQPALRVLRLGLTRLAVPRSGDTGRRERARSTRQSTAKGQARSGRDGAGLIRDADGSRRWATALLTGTFSGRTPEHRSSAVSPALPVPAGPSCVAAGTSGEDCGEPSRRHRLSYVPPVTGRR